MTQSSIDLDDQLEIVAHRSEFIDLLDAEGPLAPRDIVEALDHSRSTVTRALRTLQEAGLIDPRQERHSRTDTRANASSHSPLRYAK